MFKKINNLNLSILVLLFITGCASNIQPYNPVSNIRPFTSDGCSSFPDGTENDKTLWQQCCFVHDKAYWQGGTREEREKADLALQACVADKGEPAIALIMLVGVRIGGSPDFSTTFRWGYGWPYLREYKKLSKSELEKIRLRLDEYELKKNNMTDGNFNPGNSK